MRQRSRTLLAAAIAAAIVASSGTTASAAFSPEVLSCRAAISKNASKLIKTYLKTITGCHKSRAKDIALMGTDCNALATADLKGKLASADAKFLAAIGGAKSKCAAVADPGDALYSDCPSPCNSLVPDITDFGDVAQCLQCLIEDNLQEFSEETNGTPDTPLAAGDASCQNAIGGNGAKYFNLVVKDVTKCQSTAEKAGVETTTQCTDTGFPSDAVDAAANTTQDAIAAGCGEADIDNLDTCGGAPFTVSTCVPIEVLIQSQELLAEVLNLGDDGGTTTTTTTSTTLPSAEGCPNVGELTLFSRDTNTACTNNGDCTAPRTCNTTLGICQSRTDLDSGWNGVSHDADINDEVTTRARLYCPDANSGTGCGECTVEGIDPEPGNCRCANNTRTICGDPFDTSPDCPTCDGGAREGAACSADADCASTCATRCSNNASRICTSNADCSSPGTCGDESTCSNRSPCTTNSQCSGTCTAEAGCECFFGAPFPLAAGGTPACILNRFSEDIVGTANVDLGAGEITASLRTQVFLGIDNVQPCPTCDGDPTPGDGVRGGTCNGGRNNGLDCDEAGNNASFPLTLGGGEGGGGYSLDCLPSVGLGVSGQGLALRLEQTTGSSSLTAEVDCDAGGVGSELCQCMVCSRDPSVPCNSDADCASQGGNCSTYPTIACTMESDCTSANAGVCSEVSPGNFRCSTETLLSCTTNSDCQGIDAGSCELSSCSAKGSGGFPAPNECDGLACTDLGGGVGECTTGPDTYTCDGLVKANGDGSVTCNPANGAADCTAVDPLAGDCTLVKRRPCFLDPIVGQGSPDPEYPVAAAVFCIPPTSNVGINNAAGLPGPGRAVNQGQARTFCASDNNVQYQPGGDVCP